MNPLPLSLTFVAWSQFVAFLVFGFWPLRSASDRLISHHIRNCMCALL